MVKSRQRGSKNKLIIQTKINWYREVIITIFSIFVWLYCAGVVAFFISALVNVNPPYISLIKTAFKMTNKEIWSFMWIVFCIWLIFYIVLWCWKNYNLKRFGSLNRRTQPIPTTKKDILSLGLMDEKDFQLLHQSRVVVFEKNPIKDIRK